MLEIKVCKITGKCPVYNSEDKSPADIIGINEPKNGLSIINKL
jgi:hypothetical protein